MQNVLLMCRSLTYAQRTERLLERAGISGYIQRAPAGASKRGCGYCVRLRQAHLEWAMSVLEQEGFLPERVLRPEEDGSFREVSV